VRRELPADLGQRPFTVEEALRSGITRRQLQGRGFRRLVRGLYCAADLAFAAETILWSALRFLPEDAVFSGATAAWLHGLDTEPCQPIEVTVPDASWLRPRLDLAVVRTAIDTAEIVRCRGLPATSILRTTTDLGRRASLVDATVALDEALHRSLVDQNDLDRFARAHRGAKGIARLRRVLELVEPASESPMETRLRLVMVLAGLPQPAAQVSIVDRGLFVARPDLLYEAERLAIEYDGATHRDSLEDDNRRQNRLINAGYRVLRFTAADVHRNPTGIVAQVRSELAR
jgi:hypothetical protein